MKRAVQTAAEIRRVYGNNSNLNIDKRLREIDFGSWEMKSFAEIAQEEPERVDEWAEGGNFVFPGGDSIQSFQNRIAGMYEDMKNLPAKEVCVVTHGGVIRTMICLALGLSMNQYLLFSVQPGTMTVLDLFSEGAILAGLNL